MTLEERIEEIECWKNEVYYSNRTSDYVEQIENALSIIQELQNKNKELEAKLKELNNDK